jgi:hypothetical protein
MAFERILSVVLLCSIHRYGIFLHLQTTIAITILFWNDFRISSQSLSLRNPNAFQHRIRPSDLVPEPIQSSSSSQPISLKSIVTLPSRPRFRHLSGLHPRCHAPKFRMYFLFSLMLTNSVQQNFSNSVNFTKLLEE